MQIVIKKLKRLTLTKRWQVKGSDKGFLRSSPAAKSPLKPFTASTLEFSGVKWVACQICYVITNMVKINFYDGQWCIGL